MSKISNQSQCAPIIYTATLMSRPRIQFPLLIQDKPIRNFFSFLQNISIQQSSSWVDFRLLNSDVTKGGVHFSSEIAATWPYHRPENQIHAITSHFFKLILILSFHLLLLHRHWKFNFFRKFRYRTFNCVFHTSWFFLNTLIFKRIHKNIKMMYDYKPGKQSKRTGNCDVWGTQSSLCDNLVTLRYDAIVSILG
jgi:hypothetical protein